MKRLVLMIVPVLISGMILTSCSSDMEKQMDDSSVTIETAKIITTNIEIGDRDVAFVKAIITNMLCLETDACRIEFEVAASKFQNGGFEVNFFEDVPDEYLEPLFVDNGFTISDNQAKIGIVILYAFDSAGRRIGNFEMMSSIGNDNYWSFSSVYADRSFTMKGKTEYGLEVDYSFNKGWNMIYYYHGGANYYTTQKPSNVDFKCFFPIPIRCGS